MLNTLIVKKTNMYTSHALIYTNASVSKTFLLSPIQTNISLFKRSYPGSTPKLPKINPKLKENQASDSNIQNKFNLPTSEILQPVENESEVSKYLKTTNIPCQNQTEMENSTSQNNTAPVSTSLKTLTGKEKEFKSFSPKVLDYNPILLQETQKAMEASLYHVLERQSNSNTRLITNEPFSGNISSQTQEDQATQKIILECLEKKILMYEDTKEVKSGGNLTLTKEGYKLYKNLHKIPVINKNNENLPSSKITYEVGILKVDIENTIILLPSQTHLVV